MPCSCGCGGKCPKKKLNKFTKKFPMISTQFGNGMLSVPSFICEGRKRRGIGAPTPCCSKSHLRGEGIKPVPGTRGVYFADANLICTGALCSGRDRYTVYEWTFTPTDKANPGNLRIVGSSRKVGNDRVEVAGTGTFDLHVKVTFQCESVGFKPPIRIHRCVSSRTVRFTL